jgi:hypothetical protein
LHRAVMPTSTPKVSNGCREVRLRKLKTLKLEPRRNRAPGQRPRTQRFCHLPMKLGYEDLRSLAFAQVRSEQKMLLGAAIRQRREPQRPAAIPVPDLVRIDAMPSADLACRQQIINGEAG